MKERAVRRSVSLCLSVLVCGREMLSDAPPARPPWPISQSQTGTDTHSRTHACMYTHMHRITMVTASPLSVLESNCKQHWIIQEIKLQYYKYYCKYKKNIQHMFVTSPPKIAAISLVKRMQIQCYCKIKQHTVKLQSGQAAGILLLLLLTSTTKSRVHNGRQT